MRGIEAADVEGRIGFGVTEALRLFQTLIERKFLALHARQDVIAGAVQNPVDALDRVARETLAQRLHDRNAAGDGGLEGKRHVLLFRNLRKCQSVLRQQRLVGGDNMLAGGERRLDRGARRTLVAAHELDEKIDVGRARQRHWIVEHFQG